jgi:hypothetical protein
MPKVNDRVVSEVVQLLQQQGWWVPTSLPMGGAVNVTAEDYFNFVADAINTYNSVSKGHEHDHDERGRR